MGPHDKLCALCKPNKEGHPELAKAKEAVERDALGWPAELEAAKDKDMRWQIDLKILQSTHKKMACLGALSCFPT